MYNIFQNLWILIYSHFASNLAMIYLQLASFLLDFQIQKSYLVIEQKVYY